MWPWRKKQWPPRRRCWPLKRRKSWNRAYSHWQKSQPRRPWMRSQTVRGGGCWRQIGRPPPRGPTSLACWMGLPHPRETRCLSRLMGLHPPIRLLLSSGEMLRPWRSWILMSCPWQSWYQVDRSCPCWALPGYPWSCWAQPACLCPW